MNHIKKYSRWLTEAEEFDHEAFVEKVRREQTVELIAMAIDPSISMHQWIEEFDDKYDGANLKNALIERQKKNLRTLYASGEYDWTYRYYKALFMSNDDTFIIDSGRDQADFDKLKSEGWEVYFEDIDGETYQRSQFFYLLKRKADPKRFSSEVKDFILKNHPPYAAKMTHLMSDKDSADIRGAISSTKYGI